MSLWPLREFDSVLCSFELENWREFKASGWRPLRINVLCRRYSIRYINIREKMTSFAWISLLKGIETSSQHKNIGRDLEIK